MRHLFSFILALALPNTLPTAPANACTVQWKKGKSPKEVRRSLNIRKIKGTYKLDELAGRGGIDEDGEEVVYNARFLGTITSESGKKWKTVHEPVQETGISCVDVKVAEFMQPKRDAQGIFWVEIRTRRGRHKLRDWDGEYVPVPENDVAKD
jgi:hypothetical protein